LRHKKWLYLLSQAPAGAFFCRRAATMPRAVGKPECPLPFSELQKGGMGPL
jgi:hypothetical protein